MSMMLLKLPIKQNFESFFVYFFSDSAERSDTNRFLFYSLRYVILLNISFINLVKRY